MATNISNELEDKTRTNTNKRRLRSMERRTLELQNLSTDDEDQDVILIEDDVLLPLPQQNGAAHKASVNDLKADELLARQLQQQYDKEARNAGRLNRMERNSEQRPHHHQIGFIRRLNELNQQATGTNANPSSSSSSSSTAESNQQPTTSAVNANRNNNNKNASNNSGNLATSPSFETDMLYSLVRQDAAIQRAMQSNQNNNRSRSHRNPTNQTAAASATTETATNQSRATAATTNAAGSSNARHRARNARENGSELNLDPFVDGFSLLSNLTRLAMPHPTEQPAGNRNASQFRPTNSNNNFSSRSRGHANGFHIMFTNRTFGNGPDNMSYENLLGLADVKKTLKKSEIDSLPVFEFKRAENGDENANTCSICFEDYARGSSLMGLACCHKFHKDCITQWFKESRLCPVCKKDAVSEE